METSEIWKNALDQAQQVLSDFTKSQENWKNLQKFTDLLYNTLSRGGTLFSCGNGGSHCDAMHFAEELTGRYRKERRPLGALALGDGPHVTCVGNDYGFEHIYERQLRALARKGDALLCLSTSGNSKNLIYAVNAAKEMGLETVALLGRDGGKLKSMVTLPIVVPAESSDRIQEVHIKLIHTVIETLERKLFPELYK